MDMDAQGNRFLLDSPQLVAVRCHRNANAAAERDRFLAMAARGAVLVSPSVSEGEQLAMNSAMKAGFPVIFVRRSGFSDFAKPGGELFDRCAAGQLLQLSPWPYTTRQEPLTRKKCLAMNDVAADICAGHDLLL